MGQTLLPIVLAPFSADGMAPSAVTISSDSQVALAASQLQSLPPSLQRRHLENPFRLQGQFLSECTQNTAAQNNAQVKFQHTPSNHNLDNTDPQKFTIFGRGNCIVDALAHRSASNRTSFQKFQVDNRFDKIPEHLVDKFYLRHNGITIDGHLKQILSDRRDVNTLKL